MGVADVDAATGLVLVCALGKTGGIDMLSRGGRVSGIGLDGAGAGVVVAIVGDVAVVVVGVCIRNVLSCGIYRRSVSGAVLCTDVDVLGCGSCNGTVGDSSRYGVGRNICVVTAFPSGLGITDGEPAPNL